MRRVELRRKLTTLYPRVVAISPAPPHPARWHSAAEAATTPLSLLLPSMPSRTVSTLFGNIQAAPGSWMSFAAGVSRS